MRAPFIGITTWRRHFDTELGSNRAVHSIGVEYTAPIEREHATVVLLPPTGAVDEVLSRFDGLLLSGGEDVSPTRYGKQAQPGMLYDSARDEFEIALIRGARERKIPVLAICRGMQLTNVAFGGDLVVDLPHSVEHRVARRVDDQLAERHSITIAEDSSLAGLYGARHRVNTIHHQAIDTLAPGFREVAWATDGVIEAVESNDSDWPFWAVQWHPEKMTDPNEVAGEQPLFAAFVAAARDRAAIAVA